MYRTVKLCLELLIFALVTGLLKQWLWSLIRGMCSVYIIDPTPTLVSVAN